MSAAGMSPAAAAALVIGAVERASPTGQEGAVAHFLRDSVAAWADAAEVDGAGNVAARFGSGPRRIVLLGHIDTAPGWWPVQRDGRWLHGRGAVDAKGSLCAMLAAASRLDAAARRALTVQVIGAVEEEAASSRGARYALANYAEPELVIIGEPSGWDAITLGYKGRSELEVRVRRPEGHSARDDATAAATVCAAWSAARAWAERESADESAAFERVQATLLDVHAESDGLEQRAHARIAFRLPPRWPPELALAAVERTITEALPDAPLHFKAQPGERAARSARDGALQRALRSAIRAEGGRPRHLVKTGTSDMNVVAAQWRAGIVAYGPGDASLDHTPEERLDLDEYERAVRVLERTLTALADETEPAVAQTPDRS